MKSNPIYALLGSMFRFIGALLTKWKLVLIALVIFSPVGPHLRWEYTYSDYGSYRVYRSCTYLGTRGFVVQQSDYCPVLTLIDTRTKETYYGQT